MTDTKAYWKRRALKAEAEVDAIRKCRIADNSMERRLCREVSTMRAAMQEIESAIQFIKEQEHERP